MSQQIRCHRCSHWIGESSAAVEFVGLFKRARDREQVEAPRIAWKCSSCGWTNVFQPTTPPWRDVETKSLAEVGG